MPFPSRLGLYMAWQTLIGLFAALAVVATIIILVDFVEQSRAIGTRVDVTAMDLMGLTLIRAPMLIEQTLPFVFLFGVLGTMFRLNRRSELIVMRASGFSAWRIMTAPILIALAAGVAAATMLNPLGAALNVQYEHQRNRLTATDRQVATQNPVWLRESTPEGFAITAARGLDAETRELIAPSFQFFVLGPAGAPIFERRIDASSARLQAGFWALTGAVERERGEEAVDLGEVSIPTSIDRQALFERSRSPTGVPFWGLPGLIDSARASGLAAHRYELRWQRLLAFPLTLIAATLIATAATLRLQRLGGAAGFVLIGGAAGFLMFFVAQLLQSFGETGALTPVTASWAAPALTTILALIYVAATEDG